MKHSVTTWEPDIAGFLFWFCSHLAGVGLDKLPDFSAPQLFYQSDRLHDWKTGEGQS